MSFYLNPRIIEDLREAVIQSAYLQKEVDKFNLVCAVMDRLDSASRYLNDHSEYPKDESQYLAFMAYACMICDSHDALRLVVLGTKEKDETEKEADKEHKILGDIFMKEPFSLSEDEPCEIASAFLNAFASSSEELAYVYPENIRVEYKEI